jgi:hypothetical protein
MVFFTVVFQVLVFALCAGVVVSILVFVPLSLYIIPYALWVGNEQTMGRQMDKKKQTPFQAAKNATKLYGAWIRRQKPTL